MPRHLRVASRNGQVQSRLEGKIRTINNCIIIRLNSPFPNIKVDDTSLLLWMQCYPREEMTKPELWRTMAREIRTPKRKRKSWVVLVGKVQDLHAVTPQGTNTGVTTNTPILHADSYRLSFKYLDTGLPTPSRPNRNALSTWTAERQCTNGVLREPASYPGHTFRTSLNKALTPYNTQPMPFQAPRNTLSSSSIFPRNKQP